MLRDVIVERGGLRTIEAVLVRADGSGVGAEAGNWTIAGPDRGTPIGQGGLAAPRVTRDHPLYTVEQLGRLARNVDSKVSACLENTSCS